MQDSSELDAPSHRALANSGDIIVTARRREELAQDVPVAVTVFSSALLQERHITTGQDLQGQVPSMVVGTNRQGRDVESFTIRGQGTGYFAPPSVVLYLAETPMASGKTASAQGGPGQFLDLANVQVLRGPQGTLFGRNTTGSAILFDPAMPTANLGGYVQVQAGNYRDREVEAVLNVPVSSKLQVLVAGRFVDRKGFTEDVVSGIDYGNRHYYSGRLGVLWRAAITMWTNSCGFGM